LLKQVLYFDVTHCVADIMPLVQYFRPHRVHCVDAAYCYRCHT